jgi:uncharacterized protein (DUF3084 family)
VNEDIIETLRSIQCSDAACGNLRIAMGMKLAIYEIERLRADLMCLKTQNAEFVRALTMAQDERNAAVKERDEARREVSSLASRNYLDNEAAIRRVTELARCDPKPAMSFKDAYSMNYAEKRGWDCFRETDNG